MTREQFEVEALECARQLTVSLKSIKEIFHADMVFLSTRAAASGVSPVVLSGVVTGLFAQLRDELK